MYAYPAGPPGADDAFAAMCERYRLRLVAFCRRRLRVSHDAEDAAHETLLRAHRALPGFDLSSDAWPWLRTVASRVCLDIERRAARPLTPDVADVDRDDVHDQVVQRLRADILEDALEQLPARYRTPLVLKEYGGWTYDDIARTRDSSLSSVRSLLSRSRRRLGSHVEAVARDRGQWPLPGMVPPVQRLRGYVRSWRDAIDRSGHALVGAFELSTMASRWLIGANATLAGILGLSTAATAVVLPLPSQAASTAPPASMAPASPRMRAAVDTPTAAPVGASASLTMQPLERETYAAVETSTPVPKTFGGTATITGNEDHLWIGWEGNTTVPGYDSEGTTGTNVPCNATLADYVVCTAARVALPYVPNQ